MVSGEEGSHSQPDLRLRPSPRAISIAALVTSVLLSAVLLDVSPLLRGPSPYPPEWQWNLRATSSLRGLGPAIACTLGLLGLLWLSATGIARRRPRRIIAICLPLLTTLSLGLQLSLLAMERGHGATDILIKHTASQNFTSYHTVAMELNEDNISDFLDQYPTLLEQFPIHARTHPPGTILYFWQIKRFLEARPRLVEFLIDVARDLDVDQRFVRSPRVHVPVAAALLGVCGLLLLTNLGCAAILLLAWALGAPSLQAMRIAVVWVFVPSFCLMIPQFDHVLLVTGTLFAALLTIGLRAERRSRRLISAGIAGLVGGIGMFVSYGAAAFLVFGAVVAVAATWDRLRESVAETASVLLVTLLCAVAVVLGTFTIYDGFETIPIALEHHAKEYTRPRSYATWVLFNLWDLGLFLGCPVFVLFCRRVYLARRRGDAGWSSARWITLATCAALLMLNFSGTVRGEVGRIWLPIMPFFLIGSLLTPDAQGCLEDADRDPAGPSAKGAAILVVMLFVCDLVLRYSWHLP